MKNEDFTSLEVEVVLSQVLTFCHKTLGVGTVHWLSAEALTRLRTSSADEWQWWVSSTAATDKHRISMPRSEGGDLTPVWRKINKLFANATNKTGQVIRSKPHGYYAYPVIFAEELQGVLLFENITSDLPKKLFSGLKPGLELAAKYVAFAYRHLEAKSQSFIDELTGLYNQRYLPSVLMHETERCRRDGSEFCLLFLDVDFFKSVNDSRGHWAGSRLLEQLGVLLKSQVRSCDYAFRYGGDEFILLLSGSNAVNSAKVAERIRKAVEAHQFQIDGQPTQLTISVGLAAYPEHAKSAQELIRLADQAMYYSKRKSRNIVTIVS